MGSINAPFSRSLTPYEPPAQVNFSPIVLVDQNMLGSANGDNGGISVYSLGIQSDSVTPTVLPTAPMAQPFSNVGDPGSSASGERERNAQDDSALKDCGDTVPNNIALRESQKTTQDYNALKNCQETAADETVLREQEVESIAQDDNSLRVQEPKASNMKSSPRIESDAYFWPERFADGKSDITFESIPCVRSFSNQVKSWIEDKTLTTIIWWPLAPRRRPLQPNCVQVTWTCVSSYVADLCQLGVR